MAMFTVCVTFADSCYMKLCLLINKGNNKITELRTILQTESQNS